MGDLLSALGLLLTVLTAIYGYWSQEFSTLGAITPTANRGNHVGDETLLNAALARAVPLALYAFGLALIAAPPAWQAIASAWCYVVDPNFRSEAPYNAVRTALVMVEVGLVALATLVCNVVRKMWSVRATIRSLPQ
jgi:hypothetical protein